MYVMCSICAVFAIEKAISLLQNGKVQTWEQYRKSTEKDRQQLSWIMQDKPVCTLHAYIVYLTHILTVTLTALLSCLNPAFCKDVHWVLGLHVAPNPFLTSWPVDVHHLQVYACAWGYAESWSNICRKQFAERLEVIAYPERERRRIVGAALGVSLHCVQCKPPTIQCNNIWLPSHAHNTWLMHCLHYCSCLMSSYAA